MEGWTRGLQRLQTGLLDIGHMGQKYICTARHQIWRIPPIVCINTEG